MTSLRGTLERLGGFLQRLRRARVRYGRSYPSLLIEFVDLYCRQGYTAKEIFQCELLNREPRAEKRRTAISKAALIALQQQLNSAESAGLVEDKSLFYAFCRERGLPVPRQLAVWGRAGGRTSDGAALESETDWLQFLEAVEVPEIVIKPSLGVYGRGIRFLRRDSGTWVDPVGKRFTAGEILGALRDDKEFDHFVIQARVMPHASFVALSGTSYLQTLRLVTAVDGAGHAEILVGEMMVICGHATKSNFSSGASGNAICDIDLETGTLVAVLLACADGVGMDEIAHHPVTGVAFAGFTIPFWQEACKLCREAALAVLPLRTVGWDVGITASGPVLLEGNAWWDTHSHTRRMGLFLQYARDMLERTPHAVG